MEGHATWVLETRRTHWTRVVALPHPLPLSGSPTFFFWVQPSIILWPEEFCTASDHGQLEQARCPSQGLHCPGLTHTRVWVSLIKVMLDQEHGCLLSNRLRRGHRVHQTWALRREQGFFSLATPVESADGWCLHVQQRQRTM